MTTDLQWRRVAFEWHLYLGRRRVGRVIPDAVHKGMWRSVMPDDSLSDMANLSWAKSAVLASVERDLDYEARNRRSIA